ncbi:MAG: hypothetical protein ABFS56_25480 [Pseudomonadota bacterium]
MNAGLVHSCEEQDTAKYDGQSQKPASRRKEMTCDNRLFLRALSRPEFDFKPRKHPVDGDIISEFSLGVLKHLWRYVYAVITDPQSKYWREHALRAIVLLTDEPGTRRQDSSQLVKSALEKALEKPAQLLAEMGEDSSQLDDWDYTPIWALFTPLKKSILFRPFKKNLTELTYPQRIIDLHVKADDEKAQITAQRKKLREQIYETIGELQNSINSRLRLLANRLTVATSSDNADKSTKTADAKKTSKIAQVDSNTLISQAGLEAAFQQHGITAEDISAINALAFIEGYANKQYSYHSYPTFREVIVIENSDLNMLHRRIDSFVSELDNAFTRFSVCDPKAAMAAALFQALAQVSGNEDWLQKLAEMNTREQCRYARNWLLWRELENQTIAELIGIADILPVSDEGLLGMEKRDFRRMSPNEMGKQHNILADKVVCMNNILKGRTVPNDVKSCQRHRSRAKNWDYTPVGSTNHYIYLPRHLVP